MATKNKLYAVNKWNKLQFGNAFALGGNTSIWERLAQNAYENAYGKENHTLSDYMYGTTAAEGNNSWLNISKANNPFSRGNIGGTISAAATAVSPFTTNLISGGYSTGGVGEGISGVGNAVGSAVGGPLGAAITLGSGIIGGLTNRAFGTKNNDANINAINQNTALAQNAGTALARASDTNSLLSAAQTMTGGTGFGTKDLVKGGWFSKGKARKKGQKYLDTEAAALTFQNNALQAGAANVDRNIDNTALTSFAAFGGLLDYPNTFADGGIHISPSKKGTFTAAAKKRGLGVQEFASRVIANPDNYSESMRKKAQFAKNAAKWHGLGGVLNTGNPWNGNSVGSLNLMQNNDYIDAINNRTAAMYNKNNMGITGAMNAFGGELGTNGTDFSNGLFYIDEGKSHEENPYGGVQVGVDPEGTPNLVEEGETIYNDYVFSDRMKVPEFMYNQLGIKGANKDGISFAKASKKLAKESEQRPNDPISLDGLDAVMSKLAIIQETERLKKQVEEQNQFAKGGKVNKFDGRNGSTLRRSTSKSGLQQLRDLGRAIQNEYGYQGYHEYGNPAWTSTWDMSTELSPLQMVYPWTGLPNISVSNPYVYTPRIPTEKELEGAPKLDTSTFGFNWGNNVLYGGVPFRPAAWTPYPDTAGSTTADSVEDTEGVPMDSTIKEAVEEQQQKKGAQETGDRGRGTSKGSGRASSSRYSGYSSLNDYIASQLQKTGEFNYGRVTDGNGNPIVIRQPGEGRFLNSQTINRLSDALAVSPTIDGSEVPSAMPTGDVRLRTENTTTGTEQGENDTLPHYATWMRYAPAVGAGIMTLTDLLGLTNRPDYSSAERIEAAANAMAQSGNVAYNNPLGNYIQYRPMDITYGLNQLASQARATDRAIQNTAGTRGAATNAMIANGYNSQLASGNLYRQALEYNDALQRQAEEFNRGTDQFNAQMGLEAAIANARYRQAGLNARLSGLAQAAAIKDSIDQRVGAARSANITNLLNSLGNIGRENFAFNQINSTAAANNGYGYGNRGGDVTHSNTGAKGGKLKRKNKK